MKIPAFALVPSQWFASLGQRERGVLFGGTLLLVGLLGWEWVVQPGLEWRETQSRLLVEKTKTLAWMQQSATEVARLKSGTPRPSTVAVGGESLLALADRTAREKGLGSGMKRVEPDGEDRVRLWFEKIPFAGLMGWMTELADKQGARAQNVTVDREEEPGLVRARVVLSWPEKVGNRGLGK